MEHNMFKKAVLLICLSILSAGMLLAEVPLKSSSVKARPMTPDLTIDDFSLGTPVDGLGPAVNPLNTDDPVGQIFLFGTTWNDIQHNAGCGRQIQVDNLGWVHVAWMNGLNNGASDRHIFYQLMNTNDQLLFTGGVQVDQSIKSGYTVLELFTDNRAMPAFHQQTAGSANYHSALAFDYFPQTGAFSTRDLPWVYVGSTDLKVEWPHMDRDSNGVFHIISSDGTTTATLHDIYYCRATFDPFTYSIDFSDQYGNQQQELFTQTPVISTEVACSPVSDKVAVGWLQWGATGSDTTQYDNDIVVVVSQEGVEFAWDDTINITNWIPPDYSLLPDTLLADKDTLRVYPDICLFYDYDDVLHVIFSTRGYYSLEGTLTWGNGFIWHWDELNQVYSMVADGWFSNGYYDPGAWNIYACRASAGIDAETGDIYCMYQRYFHPPIPIEYDPFPYMQGDTLDWSAAGFPNGEVWMTKSIDGGYTWAEGIDITNTHSPDAPAGQCQSELTPSMAPDVTNDNCHVFYILDKDAGAVNQSEGTWTLNDVVYHRVPISLIPAVPLLPPYPMHVDSTGYPWPVSVEETGVNSPAQFKLEPNYPNPFNPETTINFTLKTSGFVSLKVYDLQGREVAELADGAYTSGTHSVDFNAANLASGVYICRLTSSGYSQTQKMVLLK